jgi:hypothetical protein
MAKYSTDLDRTGNIKGVGTVSQPASALHRFKVYEAFVGLNGGTPSDAYREWQLLTITAAATGTTVTPAKIDPADGTATMIALDVITAEGTESTILSTRSVHERASYTWVFYPGTELIFPVTNLIGCKLMQQSASATVTKGNILFEE